ncbi:MAG: sensor histidine kinase [Gemmatimonadales bacterium]|nr:sensor histidine kinase [Gemmatimonadales bacterium]
MPDQPVELWVFYAAATTVAGILVVAVGAAVIVSQRKLVRTVGTYAARQVAVMEEERARVARELHDDISQRIAILSQYLEAIQEGLEEERPAEQLLSPACAAADALRELAASVSTIAHRMHPSALDHLGLGPALKQLAEEMATGQGWQLDLQLDRLTDPPHPETALALYRIAQEGLRNAARHAAASRVMVRLTETPDTLQLEIRDNGVGLPAPPVLQAAHLGFLSMSERARLVGGQFACAAGPDGGTSVEVAVPRAPAAEAP